jgi:hypothetical protein
MSKDTTENIAVFCAVLVVLFLFAGDDPTVFQHLKAYVINRLSTGVCP